MPITVQWDDTDETIMRNEFSGKWTWEEFFDANRQASTMIAAKNYRCDIIANMRPGTMESAGPALYNARQVMREYPPNFGLLVVVTNPLLGMLTNVFKRFDTDLGSRVVSVATLDQARELIARERVKK